MATETRGVQYWQQQAAEEATRLREEARRLKAAGHSIAEIARRLNRHPQTVRDWFWSPDRSYTKPNPKNTAMTRKEKAREMASVYDDPVTRAWIYKQMGLDPE